MKKINKTILPVITIGTLITPIAVSVSCASIEQKELNNNNGINIGYWPDLDLALSLNANVISSAQSSDHFATWFPKGSRFEKSLSNLKINKPLWDADAIDEEYWRNLNGRDKAVGLVYEEWIKTPQKQFLKDDPNIIPIKFDYNSGVPNQKYHWNISDFSSNSAKAILLENKGDKNYENMGDLWQIRDMGAILKTASSSLDNVYKTNIFSKKAKNIIKTTNDHWEFFRTLQEKNNSHLNKFTSLQLEKRNLELESGKKNNQIMGTSKEDDSLLVINIKTGTINSETGNISIATPSSQKEVYTKAHFTMPNLYQKQFDFLKRYSNLGNDGKAIEAGATNNGIYFPNGSQAPLPFDFWEPWENNIDKIVIGISHKEFKGKNQKYFIDLYNQQTNALSTGKLLKSLLGENLSNNNVVFVDQYLAGSDSYGFRMPIGQNVFIDELSKYFYSSNNSFDWKSKI